MMRKEHCEAVVVPHRETQELYFWVFRGTKPSKMECIAGVPLASIQESGDAKAGIAALHGLLTRRFVLKAPDMQQRWKEKLEDADRRPGKQA